MENAAASVELEIPPPPEIGVGSIRAPLHCVLLKRMPIFFEYEDDSLQDMLSSKLP